MKKIIRILILSVAVLAFVHPKTLPIQAGKVTGKQIHYEHPSPVTFNDQPAASVDDDWIIECVDCPKQIYALTEHSLRLDSQGNPHIVYGGDHLYYAWHDGSVWHYETVDNQPETGRIASLALDSKGFPHIFYLTLYYFDFALKYAYKDSNGWNLQIVAYRTYGSSLSIEVDKFDRPHVGFFIENPYGFTDLMYAYLDGSDWQYETVDTRTGTELSLAVDGQGFPHLNYEKSDQLIYAYKTASGWHSQSMADNWRLTSSLALDKDNHPHISYSINILDNYTLKYTYLDSEGWHTETVDGETEADSACCSIIALDQDGNPHISYYHSYISNGILFSELKYAYRDESGWHHQIVYPQIDFSDLTTSFAVRLDGKPQIAYNRYNDNLDLVYLDPAGGWVTQPLDSSGTIGWDNSLSVDSAGYPHLSYSKNDDLVYAYKGPATWQTSLIESGAGNPSLELDALDRLHIAYRGKELNLRYAFLDENGWQIDSSIYAGEIGSGLSLALDQVDNPHITFYSSHPLYANYDGSNWQIEEISSTECSGDDSLAIDANGYPHFSAGIQYTFKDETGWHTETPGFSYDFYLDSSLALAQDGTVHIGAVAGPGIGTQYGYRDKAGWHLENVDLVGYEMIAIALNDLGLPHLIYSVFDKTGENLNEIRLAYKDSLGWHVEIVTTLFGDVSSTSLVIDKQGRIHVAYVESDKTNHGYLKYAVRVPIEYATYLTQVNSTGYALPGSTLQYTFLVTNVREQADSLNISISGNQWQTFSPTSTIPLEPGQSTKLVVQVTIPPTAALGSSDTATITLTSQSDPSISATVTLTTYAAITTYLPLVER